MDFTLSGILMARLKKYRFANVAQGKRKMLKILALLLLPAISFATPPIPSQFSMDIQQITPNCNGTCNSQANPFWIASVSTTAIITSSYPVIGNNLPGYPITLSPTWLSQLATSTNTAQAHLSALDASTNTLTGVTNALSISTQANAQAIGLTQAATGQLRLDLGLTQQATGQIRADFSASTGTLVIVKGSTGTCPSGYAVQSVFSDHITCVSTGTALPLDIAYTDKPNTFISSQTINNQLLVIGSGTFGSANSYNLSDALFVNGNMNFGLTDIAVRSQFDLTSVGPGLGIFWDNNLTPGGSYLDPYSGASREYIINSPTLNAFGLQLGPVGGTWTAQQVYDAHLNISNNPVFGVGYGLASDDGSDAILQVLGDVHATGNWVSTGSVSASYFYGDGSGLTNLPQGVCALGAGIDSVQCQGYITAASGDYSFAVGNQTTASGNYSFAQGSESTSGGLVSVALGASAHATNNYSFVFSDSTGGGCTTSADNSFKVCASGGASFSGDVNIPTGSLKVGTSPTHQLYYCNDPAQSDDGIICRDNNCACSGTLIGMGIYAN